MSKPKKQPEAVIPVEQVKKMIVFAQVQAEEHTRRALHDALFKIVGKEWSGNACMDAVKNTPVPHPQTAEVIKVFDNG